MPVKTRLCPSLFETVVVLLAPSLIKVNIMFRSGSGVTIWRLLMRCRSLAFDGDLVSRDLLLGLLAHVEGVLMPLGLLDSQAWPWVALHPGSLATGLTTTPSLSEDHTRSVVWMILLLY